MRWVSRGPPPYDMRAKVPGVHTPRIPDARRAVRVPWTRAVARRQTRKRSEPPEARSRKPGVRGLVSLW